MSSPADHPQQNKKKKTMNEHTQLRGEIQNFIRAKKRLGLHAESLSNAIHAEELSRASEGAARKRPRFSYGDHKTFLREDLAPMLRKMVPPMSLGGCDQRTAHQVMFSVLEHLNQVHGRLMRRCHDVSFGVKPEGVPLDAEGDAEAKRARKHFRLYGKLRAHDPELNNGNEGIYGAQDDLDVLSEICKSEEYQEYSESDRAILPPKILQCRVTVHASRSEPEEAYAEIERILGERGFHVTY